ncbi:hypothetical protein [Pedobacter aquatilis]|uniref:hypothetical protein n=1 Tax=Pedobacter aquatilis TaxID=351343 RepID=UPI002930ABD9|nr:hypothetical protein [Pedobacter aquatilis]
MKTSLFNALKICLFINLIICPFLANAAAYWMEIKGTNKINEQVTVRVIYGNIDDAGIRHRHKGKELDLAGDFRFSILYPNGKNEKLKLVKKEDCWEAYFTPNQNGSYRIFGINDTHPVVDRSATGGENVLPIDYLCGAYQIGDDSNLKQKPQQFLDIISVRNDNKISFTAFRNGTAENQGTKIRVFNPENWERELVLDKNGAASFLGNKDGMYNIRLDWVENKAGNYLGVNYKSIRHRCNNCVFIE